MNVPMTVAARRVTWPRTVRIIRSIYPPIALFEDIADPADWEAVASAEAKFNPRIRDSIGDLSKVPVARRVTGPGASWVMAPFVHCSPLRPGRFSDGSFGLYYAGDRTEVAIADEVASAAELVMGKATGIPVAIVRGLDRAWLRESSVDELIRPAAEDLFR